MNNHRLGKKYKKSNINCVWVLGPSLLEQNAMNRTLNMFVLGNESPHIHRHTMARLFAKFCCEAKCIDPSNKLFWREFQKYEKYFNEWVALDQGDFKALKRKVFTNNQLGEVIVARFVKFKRLNNEAFGLHWNEQSAEELLIPSNKLRQKCN